VRNATRVAVTSANTEPSTWNAESVSVVGAKQDSSVSSAIRSFAFISAVVLIVGSAVVPFAMTVKSSFSVRNATRNIAVTVKRAFTVLNANGITAASANPAFIVRAATLIYVRIVRAANRKDIDSVWFPRDMGAICSQPR
jgi:hypothetical protein